MAKDGISSPPSLKKLTADLMHALNFQWPGSKWMSKFLLQSYDGIFYVLHAALTEVDLNALHKGILWPLL